MSGRVHAEIGRPTIRFEVERWLEGVGGADEVKRTNAFISMHFGKYCASRVEDVRSQSVWNAIYVSAYPLALWLASSWWRLHYEPLPTVSPSVDWRMSHEMGAAGYGYIWPPLTLASDGEAIEVRSQTREVAAPAAHEPLTYLSRFATRVPIAAFQNEAARFISLVVARLDSVGLSDTDLHGLWREVVDEQARRRESRLRVLEAQLGFDPGEGPPAQLRQVAQLSEDAGAAAASEVAIACAGPELTLALAQVTALAKSEGIAGRLADSDKIVIDTDAEVGVERPWERGHRTARIARNVWRLNPKEPISNKALSDLLSVRESVWDQQEAERRAAPLGLAIRNNSGQGLQLLFRKPRQEARRFEAARFIGDFLLAPEGDHWLPATDCKTARQKAQRAFAAEFLVPICALQDFLKNDYSESAIESAADHFNVSARAVESHLANHDLIARF